MLRQLRNICRLMLISTQQTLVVSLVLSRLDYGNATPINLTIYLDQRRMQSVFKSSIRLIFDLRQYDHVTNALAAVFLASSDGANQIQNCITDVSSSARWDASIPLWWTGSCWWRSTASSTAIFDIHSANDVNSSAFYYWEPFISSCWNNSLESTDNQVTSAYHSRNFTRSSWIIYSKFSFLTIFKTVIIFHSVVNFSQWT